MKFGRFIASFIFLFTASAFAAAAPDAITSAVDGLTSADAAASQRSIATLRDAGPAGLRAVLARYDQAPDVRLLPIIDAVAGQHDALYSRLFWYTDLDQAKAQAKEQNRPILYLRLLGKLTDEFSCANSRFFRTVLYSNEKVSKLLRERFILVWVSERPVPVITIDYGDGRLLKRTITGNSIHYVLDSDGRVVDAFPGLFGPQLFGELVERAGMVAADNRSSDPTHARYITRTEDSLLRQWQSEIGNVNPAAAQKISAAVVVKPDAAIAMGRAMSKSAVELPMLRQAAPQFAAAIDASIDATDNATWQQIAALHADDVKLDAASIALIRRQNPTAFPDQAALDRTVSQFQTLLALDTVRDNFLFRRQILGWLRESATPIALNNLNTRVYSELFLTPRSDPWLGLMPEGAYSALTADGCCTTPPAEVKADAR